jgi:hypothetical protein
MTLRKREDTMHSMCYRFGKVYRLLSDRLRNEGISIVFRHIYVVMNTKCKKYIMIYSYNKTNEMH